MQRTPAGPTVPRLSSPEARPTFGVAGRVEGRARLDIRVSGPEARTVARDVLRAHAPTAQMPEDWTVGSLAHSSGEGAA